MIGIPCLETSWAPDHESGELLSLSRDWFGFSLILQLIFGSKV